MSFSNSILLQCMLGVKISHHLGKMKAEFELIWLILTNMRIKSCANSAYSAGCDVRKKCFYVINSRAAA